MWYLINSWKLLLENPQFPLKNPIPPFYSLPPPPLKNSKRTSLPLFAKIENFSAHPTPDSPAERGEGTVVILIQGGHSSV